MRKLRVSRMPVLAVSRGLFELKTECQIQSLNIPLGLTMLTFEHALKQFVPFVHLYYIRFCSGGVAPTTSTGTLIGKV